MNIEELKVQCLSICDGDLQAAKLAFEWIWPQPKKTVDPTHSFNAYNNAMNGNPPNYIGSKVSNLDGVVWEMTNTGWVKVKG